MSQKALFEGLVFDQAGHTLEVTTVGGEAQYVIDDEGFRRHMDAETIDRQVIAAIQEQVQANKEIVEETMMRMIGSDDLFTRPRSTSRSRIWTRSSRAASPKMRACGWA
jgi:hypothetical protein